MPDPTAAGGSQAQRRGRFHDLGSRFVSGLALAAIAFVLTYAGGYAFAGLVMAIAVVMGWEWGGIVRGTPSDAAFYGHALGVILATGLAAMGQVAFAGVSLAVAAIIVLTLSFGRQSLLSSLGVLYAGVPAVALIMLRNDAAGGLAAVLFVLMVVVAVDIGAFLGGRGIGGPKLWPRVSPNKTWAGLICGVGAGTLVGAVFAHVLMAPAGYVAGMALALGLLSQAGDMAESALKRRFGVKDASSLIPGHGGFLDRLDGVVAAATLAGIIAVVVNIAAPARALLFGS